jgi:arabinofuranan 3-O-arabinosyltransferase
MPAGTIRWLDMVESDVSAGRPDPELATLLARAGITHLVVRNDLDYATTDAPPPEVVHRLLDNSPGLSEVAHFGSSQTTYPAVEIYAVETGADDPRARVLDADEAVTVAGGSESLGQLLGDGALTEDRAMLRAPGREADHADVLTDTVQRVERAFGGIHDVVSQVMTTAEAFRTKRATHDYLYDPASPMTVARYSGISDVRASSSHGYADTLGGVHPEQGPYAAVDGSLLTSWVTSPYARVRGSWIELTFSRPTVLGRTTMQFDGENGAEVRSRVPSSCPARCSHARSSRCAVR